MRAILCALIVVLATGLQSCDNNDEEPISIQGQWIVTQWSNGSSMVEPDRVVTWTFRDDGTVRCGGETMKYSLIGSKLTISTTEYRVKFTDAYTMEWTGGYGNYKRVRLTRSFQ